MEEEVIPTPEHTVDIDSLDTSAEIASLHQEGNYLIGRTNKGIDFRQHIPQGKMLTKDKGGDWKIVDMVVM